MVEKNRSQHREAAWRVPDNGQSYDAPTQARSKDHGGDRMPLKLYLRGNVWHYRGTVAKRRLRGSTGVPKHLKDTAARKIAEIETREWKCDSDGPQAVLTFAQAALAYRSAGKSGRFLTPVEDYLKDTLVKDIKPGTIRQMAMDLYGHCSGASRNRLAVIPAQAVINYAAESELCQRIRVKRFKTDTKEKPFATLEWVQAFRKEASPQLGAYALFMLLTGARPSEALGADIDLSGATALLHESKIGHERRAHLPAMLVAAIANIKPVPGRPIFFYRKIDDLRQTWDGVIERAKIQQLTPHCCRHGFITGLLRKGIDVKTVSWLGDITPEVLLNTYAHAIKDRSLTEVLVGTDLTQDADDLSANIGKRKAI
jgi:integrase